MTAKNEIGNRIKEIRNALKLKQKEFAEKLDVSPPSLSEIETGKYNLSVESLIKLVKEYSVNLYYLLFGEGEMFLEADTRMLTQFEKYAVNAEDVHEFLYYFQRSAIMQYYILSMFKTRMASDGDVIEKEVTKFNKEQQGSEE